MNEQRNLEMFLSHINNHDINLTRINFFTQKKSFSRFFDFINLSNFFVCHVIKNKKGYSLVKNHKKYNFELLSDKIGRKVDEGYLYDYDIRNDVSLTRTLKLACSTDLVNANFIVASTNLGLRFLVEYQEGKNKKIIDYASNIIMLKEDYNQLYNLNEISRMDQATLYNWYIMFNNEPDLYLLLDPMFMCLFPKELLKSFGNLDGYSWLNEKYDEKGFNRNNYFWLGDNCDSLFFGDEDCFSKKLYSDIIDFTEKPVCDNIKFFYDKNNNSYFYLNGTSKIYFKLLSDYVLDEDIKSELLSDDRYGGCHRNSIKLLLSMDITKHNKYLVNGRTKVNEKDYFYHTWVELEKENGVSKVIDYNCNLIIDREDYYNMVGADVINKTNIADLIDVLYLSVSDFGINFHSMELGYFSQEIKRDLEKNKFLIKQKEAK